MQSNPYKRTSLLSHSFYIKFAQFLGKMGSSFKCFGAAPLENIIKNRKNLIMEDLENALAQQAPTIPHTNPDLHELPPLVSEIVHINSVRVSGECNILFSRWNYRNEDLRFSV